MACGRGAGRVDAGSTGPAGPRWIEVLGGEALGTRLAGAAGTTVALVPFHASLDVTGVGSGAGSGSAAAQLTGAAATASAAVIRFDPAGQATSATVLDATVACDARDLALAGDAPDADAIVAGGTRGSADAALGACAVATTLEDPIALRVDAAGRATLLAHATAAGGDAHAAHVAALSDGSAIVDGDYAADLAFAAPLPTAGADPNAFVTRLAAAPGTAGGAWAIGLDGAARVTAGPLAAAPGDGTCLLAAYDAPITLLGAALPAAGGFDELLAQLSPTGAPVFARGVGSPLDESSAGAGAIAADGRGGCVASFTAPGDLTLDGTALPASGGMGVVLHVDASGALAAGFRLPYAAQLAVAGGRTYAALTVTDPITIAGARYVPVGADVLVVALDDTGPTRIVATIGGGGDQDLESFAAIAPDAVAVGVVSTGPLAFGGRRYDSGDAPVRAIAAVGL